MKDSWWVWILIAGAILVGVGGGAVLMSSVSPLVQKIAVAIATAEGFYSPGTIPNRNNNPGDIVNDFTGTSTGSASGFAVYATVQDGWNALYQQVQDMLSGTSAYYNPGMTIDQIAQIYSPVGWQNWSSNVSNALGVPSSTPIGQIT